MFNNNDGYDIMNKEKKSLQPPSGLRIRIDEHDILVSDVKFNKKTRKGYSIDVEYSFITPDRPSDMEVFDNTISKIIEKLLNDEVNKGI